MNTSMSKVVTDQNNYTNNCFLITYIITNYVCSSANNNLSIIIIISRFIKKLVNYFSCL